MKFDKRLDMVDWYAPGQLLKTGIDTLISSILGASIDTRKLQIGTGDDKDCIVDYSGQKKICFDYMADTGDGWDSTYSLAYLLMRPEIEVSGEQLKRADILIMGGDEVYPVASEQLYRERLTNPFKQAAEDLRQETDISRLRKTDLFMIPGNHDWYDSLSSFSRKFFAYKHSDGSIQERTSFAQFKNKQLRSYFILKLPSNWEVWALDIQLGKDIDNQQYTFFNDHAQQISKNTNIIICIAEPEYVYGNQKDGDLGFTLDRITGLAYNKGAKVKLQLAGDVHNYQRYQIDKKDKQGNHYIRHHLVSGGGGAFLHPTHSFDEGDGRQAKIEALNRYPLEQDSKKLTDGLIYFAINHKKMAALIGGLYLAIFWQTGLSLQPENYSFWQHIFLYPINYPSSLLLISIVVIGCIAFAGFKKTKTLTLGAAHGFAHIALAIVCWCLGSLLAEIIFAANFLVLNTYLSRVITFSLGASLGGTLFGAYLWVSLNIFRVHHNEAFSALSCSDYKNFLRCKVTADGKLEVAVIGIEKTVSDKGHHPVKTHLVERIIIE